MARKPDITIAAGRRWTRLVVALHEPGGPAHKAVIDDIAKAGLDAALLALSFGAGAYREALDQLRILAEEDRTIEEMLAEAMDTLFEEETDGP